MFTGIIKSNGKVRNVLAKDKGLYVWVEKPKGWKIRAGDSISVDGICSTVKRLNDGSFEVEYMPETLKKTTAGLFSAKGGSASGRKKGTFVNLEPSLRANDRLDGHLVQGHVDTTGDVKEIRKLGNSVILRIGFPKQYKKFIAKKGSIAVNGVSLTVVAAGRDWFTVSLMSYTLRHTNLQNLKKGDKVNIEVDVLARYMDTLLK